MQIHGFLKKYGIIFIAFWSIIIAALMAITLNTHQADTIKEAENEARDYSQLNKFYRAWASKMGGIYVSIDNVAPNPYLQIPNREISSTDNRHFTLVNPAYMSRMVFDAIQTSSPDPIINKLTSLKPLNPRNSPDLWEQKNLEAFERKEYQESSEVTTISGRPYLRLISAFIADETCLKCHSHQGYKVGDVRGGITVSVPLTEPFKMEHKTNMKIVGGYSLLWLLGTVGIAVSSRKRFLDDERVYISENRLSQALYGANDGLWDWNLVTDEVYYSPRWKSMLGYEADELEHSIATWIQLVNPDDQESSLEKVRDLVEGRSDTYEVEFRMYHKDGSLRHILSRASLYKDARTGQKRLIGTHVDITERKVIEENYRRFSGLTSDYVYFCTRTGSAPFRIQWIEGAVQDISGYCKSEIMELGCWLSLVHPDDRQALNSHLLSLTPGDRIQIQFRIVTKQQGIRWVLEKSLCEAGASANELTLYGAATDITELRQVEEKLLRAQKASESANIAKSEFLANMSHELRTPMNGVIGMTQLLEMTELTTDQQKYVAALKLSGKNLMSLLSDILDLSKIEAGKITIEPDEFSLKQCINDIIMLQKFVIHEKGLKLEVDVSGDIPQMLVGDQFRLKQILLNLMGNAIKFTAAGSVTVSAHLLEQNDTTVLVRIRVRDTGIGIAPESVEQIFKAFTQEDNTISRKYGGTGLGLTISRKLAELLGGTITVESTLGVGSCFNVTLPFIIGTTIVVPQEVDAPAAPIAEWDGPSLRILLVDDDEVNTDFGVALLKRLGHSVTTADSGKACLNALEKGEFDIVLMDIQMPVMSGEEAMLEIRTKEKGKTSHLPMIALTAHSMRGDKERLLQVGFDGYVSKPLYIKDLVAEMKRIVG